MNDVFVPGFTGGISVAVSLEVSAFAEPSIPNWAAVIAIAGAEEAAARMVDIFGYLDQTHWDVSSVERLSDFTQTLQAHCDWMVE